MNTPSSLEQRKSVAKGLNIVAAAGVVLVLATAATALTFAGNNTQDDSIVVPAEAKQPT